MGFSKILDDIKKVKIQGAENIARAAAGSLKEVLRESKSRTPLELLSELQAAKEKLIAARPTEPCMVNTLNFVLSGIYATDIVHMMKKTIERIDTAVDFFQKSQAKISEIGSQKIKQGSIVFTHCHSSTVIEILKYAKKQGRHFEVHNTETRPLFQGRRTASELVSAGIPVTHYIDAAGRYALKKADVMMIGADAITSEGKVVNKIGSELLAEIACKYDIPVYVCTNSWKFDAQSVFGYEKNLEEREEWEIWKGAPKGVTINNFAFEKVDPELITGIISELGIYRPEIFVQEVRDRYPWIFRQRRKI